jgi:hypothetical protein
MKKILLLALAGLSFAIARSQTTAPGQPGQTNCACNPAGWQPVSVLINNTSSTVNCGHQFSLKCTDKITLKSLYKCIGACTAKYSAVLKNATTGAVIQSYASFTFPWSYQFTAAGNYSLEITPVCGNTRCTPCRFYFTVTCPTAACDCATDGWKPFVAYIDTAKKEVKCGFQFGVKKGKPFRLLGEYKCKGTCAAKYKAVLYNSATNTIVANYPSFTFPWAYNFPVAGSYKLEITPICGDKRCPPCLFYFTVN